MAALRTDMEKLQNLLDGFIESPDVAAPLDFLQSALDERADILIVGGALRNLIIKDMHGESPKTVDVDLILSNLGKQFSIQHLLRGENIQKTDFGGIRWYPKNSPYSFDISLLENFMPIRFFELPANLKTLIQTIDFTVNVIVYDVRKSIVHEKNILEHIKSRILGFNSKKVYDKMVLAYRTLVIRRKIGFILSRDAFDFIREALDIDTLITLKHTLKSKLGTDRAREILDDYDRICLREDYRKYRDSHG